MAGIFDDIPAAGAQAPVYGPGSAYTNTPATDAQGAYAAANYPYRDLNAADGSAANPTYDTPDRTGSADIYHVTLQGQLSAPAEAVNIFSDVPMSSVEMLPKTREAQAALKAFEARDSNQPDAAPATPFLNGIGYGFLPELMGTLAAVDTAGQNVVHRLKGEPVPYGAGDAYAANMAINRDLLGSARQENPAAAAGTETLGAILNPASRLGMGWVKGAYSGSSGLKALGMAMARSGAAATPIGAVYGAGDNPGDRLGGAIRGAVAGGGAAALAVPVGLGLGAVVTGLANGGRRLAAGPLSAMGAAMPTVTDAQAEAAQALREDMAKRGVDISVPEAVQQVTSGATGLGRSLRVLEGTKQGQSLLAPYFADRPRQVQGAVTTFADTLAPQTDFPSVIGVRANKAAEGAVLKAEQARTAATDPYYTAANPQRVAATDMEGVLRDLDAEIAADHTGLMAKPLSQLRSSLVETPAAPGSSATPPQRIPRQTPNGVIYTLSGGSPAVPPTVRTPVTDVENLDRARKYFRDRMALPPISSDAFTKEQAARVGDYLGRVDSLLEGVPAFRQGKTAFQQATKTIVDPATAGPLGTIANTKDVGAQNAALYPANPLAGAPAETSAAVAAMNGHQPGVSAALTRQHILQSLNASRPVIQSGPNAYVGSNFANRVAGNPEQQATLMAGIRAALPNGDMVADNFARLLEGLRATGMREPAGSKTAFNADDLNQMHVTALGKTIRRVADPLEWGAGLADLIDRANWKRNVEGLSRYFTAPPEQTADVINSARAATPLQVAPTLPSLPYGAVAAPAAAATRK